jgi:phenylpropionate dioxygenase-like ring-hydroxylating dioxygenase large terminal subunit
VAVLPPGTAQATLPWSWYSDHELLRREQERIFRRAWQYAGPAELAAAAGDYFDYFFPEDVSDAEVEELLAFDDQVSREDRGLVESVQRGVRSGLLESGRLLPESERLLAHFQRLVREGFE